MSQLRASLGNVKLDMLVNNAGILTEESLEDLNMDRILAQIQVNTLGPLRVTSSLLSNLKDGGKVFIITSRMGSIADNSSGEYYGYRMSKAAVNMVAKNLAIDLKPRGMQYPLYFNYIMGNNILNLLKTVCRHYGAGASPGNGGNGHDRGVRGWDKFC